MLEPSAFRAFVAGFVAVSVIGAYEKWTRTQGIDENAASTGFMILAVIFFLIPIGIFAIGYKNFAPRIPRILSRTWWYEFSDEAVRLVTFMAGALAGILLQRALQ